MKEIFNPNLYHGIHKSKNFFEGWYYKIVDRYNNYKLAIIPGISFGDNEDEHHSFIQIINGHDISYNYISYLIDNFKYSNDSFRISVDSNIFTLENINLNIINNDISIRGHLIFKNKSKWPSNLLNPGSMGFYNFLTFMECYSQVCILNGSIVGTLDINNQTIDFTGGKVYIEKNWGKSFPKSWLWIQCNSFKNRTISLTCSLANIPFPTGNFQGFLIGLTLEDRFISFTTINRSKVSLKPAENNIMLTVHKKNLKLTIETISNENDFILCKGPKNGTMIPFVKETLNGKLHMILEDTKKNKKLFEDIGFNTGIEYGGDLLNNLKKL